MIRYEPVLTIGHLVFVLKIASQILAPISLYLNKWISNLYIQEYPKHVMKLQL